MMTPCACLVMGLALTVALQPPPFPGPKTGEKPAANKPAKPTEPAPAPAAPKTGLPYYPAPPDGPPEMVEPCVQLPDMHVRLAPTADLELVPRWLLGTAEYGLTQRDISITWRMERRQVTTMKPRMVERRVRVMTTRALQKGDIHPETGEECCGPTLVSVPVDTVMRCQVLEPVTEEVAFKVPVVTDVESPVVVRRMGVFAVDQPMVAKRYRAVVFPDALGLPECAPDSGPPPDPLGRPESPTPGRTESPAPPSGTLPSPPAALPLPQPGNPDKPGA
jgi:hypothetical protein